MLKEIRLDESHSCKQGSSGGRCAWLGGLLATRSNAVEQPRLFSSFRFAVPVTEAGLGAECGVQGRAQAQVEPEPHGTGNFDL
jgi:hypothetical protein